MTSLAEPRQVRVLSIRQPWADLILAGAKTVENRTWSTGWRGVLVVHAARRWEPAGAALAAELGIPVNRQAATGYLGAVELTSVHVGRDCCSPWGLPGCFHWRLTKPHRFAEPIPGPGRLGLYQPPADVAHRLAEAIAGDEVTPA